MKIDNCDIEFVFDEEEYTNSSQKTRFHTLQFVTTPRGRRKILIMIREEFERGKHTCTEVDLSGAKTVTEKRRLLSQLLRGCYRPQTRFESITIKMLEAPYTKTLDELFVRFST